jgi:competence protein ComEA
MFAKSTFAALALAFSAFLSAGQPVNINTATAAELAESLDGIGEVKAKAIVAYRQANGGFKSADELTEVKGIGLKTVERNAQYIKLGAAPKPATPPAK